MTEWHDLYEYGDVFSRKIKRLKEEYFQERVLYIPCGVEVIEHNAFEGSQAEAICIGNTLKEIHECAFAGCKKLKYLFVPKTLLVIHKNALEGCENVSVYCDGEEQYCWVHPEKFWGMYIDPVGFNFHRSSGGWMTADAPSPIEDDEPRPFNPLRRPVYTNVPFRRFWEIAEADGLSIDLAI